MKKVLLGILVVIVIIQFIRPEKNVSKASENDISTVVQIPENVNVILQNACNDCHSNYTKYTWYSEIAPVSWFLAHHVNEGKEHLNFSEWTAYNENQKDHIIHDIEEVLESHEMPLKSYIIMHKEADLTNEQFQTLLDWAKTLK